ncbi:MAG: PadR family transcriptional regulator [Spirochaetia bacterium]|nr:PadR family transcriptional regulator [Spirochaetia bacterium]
MNTEEETSIIIERNRQELSRGVITLALLTILSAPHYGYSLQKELQNRSFEISQDTLYPLLRRLEKQNLLISEWVVEDPRPRKYYRVSVTGLEVCRKLREEWDTLHTAIGGLLHEYE